VSYDVTNINFLTGKSPGETNTGNQ